MRFMKTPPFLFVKSAKHCVCDTILYFGNVHIIHRFLYPVTICNHTVIFTNGELATVLQSLPEKKREIRYAPCMFLYKP